MKYKFDCAVACVLAAALLILLGFSGCAKTPPEEPAVVRAETGFVVEIDMAADVYTVETEDGNLWEIEGVEDWFLGDGATVFFATLGTSDVRDDVVLRVLYNGTSRGVDN